jgi:hypothetical protein
MGVSVRTTVGLLAVLAVLAGYVIVVDRPGQRRGSDGAAPLLSLPRDQVVRVELQSPSARIVVVRNGAGWSDERVDGLLDALHRLAPLGVIAESVPDPAAYGFGSASLHLHVLDRAGKTLLALEVGGRNPPSTGLYVRHEGSTEILLVGALLAWEIEKLTRPRAP